MQKKFFLQKNLRPVGKQSYVKILLWAAVVLVILVIISPLFITRKGPRELVSQRSSAERSGVVTGEIPRSLPPLADSNSAVDSIPSGLGKEAEQMPAAVPDMKSFPENAGKAAPNEPTSGGQSSARIGAIPQDPQQKPPGSHMSLMQPQPPASPAVTGSEPVQAGQGAQPPLKPIPAESRERANLVPIDSSTAPMSSTGQKPKETAPAASETKKIAKAVPQSSNPREIKPMDAKMPQGTDVQKEQSVGKELFTVQVGSFKEKQNAEEMRQNLQKRGYDVVIKPTTHPKLGQLFVVQLQPVADVKRASTLVAQIHNEAKVKPVIIKTPAGQ